MNVLIKDGKIQSITSVNCFTILSKVSNSFLVDVRTKPEWEFVGVPDLSTLNKKPIFISWHEYPDMNVSNNFQKHILRRNIKKKDFIFLMCRSGQRSMSAAKYLTSCGYIYCYNVSDGFEGDKNIVNQRSTINGWKYNKLPWKQ